MSFTHLYLLCLFSVHLIKNLGTKPHDFVIKATLVHQIELAAVVVWEALLCFVANHKFPHMVNIDLLIRYLLKASHC